MAESFLPALAVGLAVFAVGMFVKRTRRAVFAHVANNGAGKPCLWIKVVNLSREQRVQVTHIWLERGSDDKAFFVIEDFGDVTTIAPAENQEFVCRLADMPEGFREDPWRHVRVRFTDGKVIEAVHNTDVPSFGNPAPQTFGMRVGATNAGPSSG